jgi:hypothetical protein
MTTFTNIPLQSQRTRPTTRKTPAHRRLLEKNRLREKRKNVPYLLAERARNCDRMRRFRACRKGNGDQIDGRRSATHGAQQ